MEIKTTSQVIHFAKEIGVMAQYDTIVIEKSSRDKKWVAVDDLIELIAMTKPAHVETVRFDMIGRKHWDKLNDTFKKRYLARAEVFVNKILLDRNDNKKRKN